MGPTYSQTLNGLPGLSNVEIASLADGTYAVSLIHNENYSGVSLVDVFAADGTNIASDTVAQAGQQLVQDQVIAALPDGGFVVSWVQAENQNNITPYAVYAQEYNAAGSAVTPVQMLGALAGTYTGPQIDAAPNGEYTVYWTSNGAQQSASSTEQGHAVAHNSSGTIVTPALDYTAPDGVRTVTMAGDTAQTVVANNLGNKIVSNDYQSTLVGGAGNDTLIAGHDGNTMTGGGGDDVFVYNSLPLNTSGVITDFNVGTDVLNLTGIFQSIGYTGTNPVADGYLSFVSDGQGDTIVEVSSHKPSDPGPVTVTTLDGVSPSSITTANYDFASDTGPIRSGATVKTSAATYTAPEGVGTIILTGNAPQTATGNNQGDNIVSNDYQSTLIGGTGNDALIAGHNSDTMTGGGGEDMFVFNYLPWNSNGVITDFNVNTDVLNLTGIFQSIGYRGTDPVGDGYLLFVPDGHDQLLVEVNPHKPGESSPIVVTMLENVMSVHQGDWII